MTIRKLFTLSSVSMNATVTGTPGVRLIVPEPASTSAPTAIAAFPTWLPPEMSIGCTIVDDGNIVSSDPSFTTTLKIRFVISYGMSDTEAGEVFGGATGGADRTVTTGTTSS